METITGIKVAYADRNSVTATNGVKDITFPRSDFEEYVRSGKICLDNVHIKCLDKNYMNGTITSYKVMDSSGNVMNVTPEALKDAMFYYRVTCENLVLTNNNRLVPTRDKVYKGNKVTKKRYTPEEIREIVDKIKVKATSLGLNYSETNIQIYKILRKKIRKLDEILHLIKMSYNEEQVTKEVGIGMAIYDEAKNVANRKWAETWSIGYVNYRAAIAHPELSYAVSTMRELFAKTYIEEINLDALATSGWTMENVISTYSMFRESYVKRIIMNNMDMSNVLFADSMFANCEFLVDVQSKNWKPNKLKHAAMMFYNTLALKNVNLMWLDYCKGELNTLRDMFSYSGVDSLDVPEVTLEWLHENNPEFSQNTVFYGIETKMGIEKAVIKCALLQVRTKLIGVRVK